MSHDRVNDDNCRRKYLVIRGQGSSIGKNPGSVIYESQVRTPLPAGCFCSPGRIPHDTPHNDKLRSDEMKSHANSIICLG